MIELKVTWEQAQGLFRPPPNDVPKIVMIEGYEIEEFEVHKTLSVHVYNVSMNHLYLWVTGVVLLCFSSPPRM